MAHQVLGRFNGLEVATGMGTRYSWACLTMARAVWDRKIMSPVVHQTSPYCSTCANDWPATSSAEDLTTYPPRGKFMVTFWLTFRTVRSQ